MSLYKEISFGLLALTVGYALLRKANPPYTNLSKFKELKLAWASCPTFLAMKKVNIYGHNKNTIFIISKPSLHFNYLISYVAPK